MSPMDCEKFRARIYHFQAGEMSEELRQSWLDHLERCAPCARRAEAEQSFGRFLRSRLRRQPAPPSLAARVRAALDAQVAGPRLRWWTFVPAAATLVLALVLGALLSGRGPEALRAGEVVRVERAATIVDLHCDRAGMSLEYQLRCRHPAHFNALRVADGQYWNLSLDQESAQEIVMDRARRGERVMVAGDYYPALGTLRIRTIRPRELASL